MKKPILFLDDGGVMTNNHARREQWTPLVGKFFSSQLGGTASAWIKANKLIIQQLFDHTNWQQRLRSSTSYTHFENNYLRDWLHGMGQIVGIPLPSDQECIQLSLQAEHFILPRIHAAFPGTSDTIKQLHTAGYTLYTASGEPSRQLTYYLETMGIRHCFQRLYGPDLIDTFKNGPTYYSQIFAELQIDPTDTLIIDDSPTALSWAHSLGAQTILIGTHPNPQTTQITYLNELPQLLTQIYT